MKQNLFTSIQVPENKRLNFMNCFTAEVANLRHFDDAEVMAAEI